MENKLDSFGKTQRNGGEIPRFAPATSLNRRLAGCDALRTSCDDQFPPATPFGRLATGCGRPATPVFPVATPKTGLRRPFSDLRRPTDELRCLKADLRVKKSAKMRWTGFHGPHTVADMSLQTCVTDSGRQVEVEEFRARYSAKGVLAGTEEGIRLRLIRRLPEDVSRTFGTNALLLREPPVGKLPIYTFFLYLVSDPIKSDANFSELVIVWFAQDLPTDLPTECANQLKGVKWEKLAQDGCY